MYGLPFFAYFTLLPPLRAYCLAVPYRRFLLRLVPLERRRVRLREVVRLVVFRARRRVRGAEGLGDFVCMTPPVCDAGLINPPDGETGVTDCLPSELKSSNPVSCAFPSTPCFNAAFCALNAALDADAAFFALTNDTALGMFAAVPPISAVLIGLLATNCKPLFTMLLFVLATTFVPLNGAAMTEATFLSLSFCPLRLKNLFLNTPMSKQTACTSIYIFRLFSVFSLNFARHVPDVVLERFQIINT